MGITDALLYAEDNIRVISVHPGFIWTPLEEELGKESTVCSIEPVRYVM